MDTKLVERIAGAVRAATSIEELAGPLLEALRAVTGLEATYLTVLDPDGDSQTVRFVHGPGSVAVETGDRFAWTDALTRPVARHIGAETRGTPADDRDLGDVGPAEIGVFLSVPVINAEGMVFGALCGASHAPLSPRADGVAVAELFARLLADRVARERVESPSLARRLRDAEERADAAERRALASKKEAGAAERRAEIAEEVAAGARQALHNAVLRFSQLQHQAEPLSTALRHRLVSRREREQQQGNDASIG